MIRFKRFCILTLLLFVCCMAQGDTSPLVFEPGHASLTRFLLPNTAPYPDTNKLNAKRVELGKQLFFDPRLSLDGNMSCATCHNPSLGWSDALPTALGFRGQLLGRASPTVINTGFNSIQMWDGRKKTLEDQAMGPMMSNTEMNMDIPLLIDFLNTSQGYRSAFNNAYPGEKIDEATLAKAIASFERTIVSNTSAFDRWVQGDKDALSNSAITGFKVFMDPQKGNCAVCHSGANFTDNGFHNIGLPSFGKENPDLGRYLEKPVRILKGAFKTPTIRDVSLTAPYFHDGSAKTLMQVVNHYVQGGVVKTNLSPNLKPLVLTELEKQALVDFMKALTSPQKPVQLPILPL